MSWQSKSEEIYFKSNVDRTLYEFFDKLCDKLGHDPKEHREKWHDFDEVTYIDAGKYVIWRGFRKNAPMGFQVDISITTPKDERYTYDDLRIKIFGPNPALEGWWFYSKADHAADLNKEYHSQKPDPRKVEEVLKEVYEAIKKLKDFADSE